MRADEGLLPLRTQAVTPPQSAFADSSSHWEEREPFLDGPPYNFNNAFALPNASLSYCSFGSCTFCKNSFADSLRENG